MRGREGENVKYSSVWEHEKLKLKKWLKTSGTQAIQETTPTQTLRPPGIQREPSQRQGNHTAGSRPHNRKEASTRTYLAENAITVVVEDNNRLDGPE